jgi:hypothetical protein
MTLLIILLIFLVGKFLGVVKRGLRMKTPPMGPTPTTPRIPPAKRARRMAYIMHSYQWHR